MASVNNWRKSNFVYCEVWLYGLYLVSFSYLCIGYKKEISTIVDYIPYNILGLSF